jgi:ribosome biogenesis GTPase A
MELLDMPGVLWPKFEDRTVGLHLAWTGAIRDEVNRYRGACGGARAFCFLRYPRFWCERYALSREGLADGGHAVLRAIARSRNMLLPGGEADMLRAAVTVLAEFRGGKIGRISLETPEDAR